MKRKEVFFRKVTKRGGMFCFPQYMTGKLCIVFPITESQKVWFYQQGRDVRNEKRVRRFVNTLLKNPRAILDNFEEAEPESRTSQKTEPNTNLKMFFTRSQLLSEAERLIKEDQENILVENCWNCKERNVKLKTSEKVIYCPACDNHYYKGTCLFKTIIHAKEKTRNGIRYACNHAVTPNLRKTSTNHSQITCKNCKEKIERGNL